MITRLFKLPDCDLKKKLCPQSSRFPTELKAGDAIITSVPHFLNSDLSQKGYSLQYWKYMKGMLYRPWHIISSLQRAPYGLSISIRMHPGSSDETVMLTHSFFFFVSFSVSFIFSCPFCVSELSETSASYQCSSAA